MEGHRLSIAGDVLFVFPLKDYLFHLTFALVHDHTLSGTHNSIILLLIPHGSHSRIQHDRTGPGQMRAVRAIATTDAITGRGNTVTPRWTPSHEGIIGNEQADGMAKRAAEGGEREVSQEYLREASLSHLGRVTMEARAKATAEWIRTRSGSHRRYRPPKGHKMRNVTPNTLVYTFDHSRSRG